MSARRDAASLMRHGLFGVLWLAVACDEHAPARTVESPPAPARDASSQAPSDPSCETSKSALRVELTTGQTSATPTGIEITFVRTGHDDFVDGRFDDWVELRFRRGSAVSSRMVSIHGEQPVEALLGACWVLSAVGSGQVTVTLFPATAGVDP